MTAAPTRDGMDEAIKRRGSGEKPRERTRRGRREAEGVDEAKAVGPSCGKGLGESGGKELRRADEHGAQHGAQHGARPGAIGPEALSDGGARGGGRAQGGARWRHRGPARGRKWRAGAPRPTSLCAGGSRRAPASTPPTALTTTTATTTTTRMRAAACQGVAMGATAPNCDGPGGPGPGRRGRPGKWERTPRSQSCFTRRQAGLVPRCYVRPWKEEVFSGRQASKLSYGKISSGTRSGSTAAHPSTVKEEASSEGSSSESDEFSSVPKRKRKSRFDAAAGHGHWAVPSSRSLPFRGGKRVNNIWARVIEEQNHDALAAKLFLMDIQDNIDHSRESETYNYLQARRLRRLREKQKLDEELDEYMRGVNRMEVEEEGDGQSHQLPRLPVRERLGPGEEHGRRRAVAGEKSEEEAAEDIFSRLGADEDDLEEFI
ncbi:uncharacterized protein LOC119947875 [Tachyglossus aculeatus]|uniref:uncharacterized protein LOC119947875 n=1 Tax=Tachyglossus aculeatus TaxID=9261 RepID=UPI0018F553E4|nr:uncharacterized protein LOC119947875 [Tachyglossus aculeatus]